MAYVKLHASMRPALFTRENEYQQIKPECRPVGFNEARVVHAGERARRGRDVRRRSCFNEARVVHAGELGVLRERPVHVVASMRPALFTRENS